MSEFLHLLSDLPHWGFEIVTDLVIGGIGGAVIWPRIKAHLHRDVLHAELHTAFQEIDPDDEVHE